MGVCFLKIGLCFYRKLEFVFLKIGVCFFENRNLFLSKIRGFFFGKSEFVFENGGLIFGNRSLSSSKIGVCLLRKSEFVPVKNRSLFFENPSIGPRFCSVFCFWVGTKSVADLGEGPRVSAPPPLAFKKSEYVFKLLHKFCPWTQLSNFDQSQRKNWTKSVTNAWSWWAKSKWTVFPACNIWLNFRVRSQFEI